MLGSLEDRMPPLIRVRYLWDKGYLLTGTVFIIHAIFRPKSSPTPIRRALSGFHKPSRACIKTYLQGTGLIHIHPFPGFHISIQSVAFFGPLTHFRLICPSIHSIAFRAHIFLGYTHPEDTLHGFLQLDSLWGRGRTEAGTETHTQYWFPGSYHLGDFHTR